MRLCITNTKYLETACCLFLILGQSHLIRNQCCQSRWTRNHLSVLQNFLKTMWLLGLLGELVKWLQLLWLKRNLSQRLPLSVATATKLSGTATIYGGTSLATLALRWCHGLRRLRLLLPWCHSYPLYHVRIVEIRHT